MQHKRTRSLWDASTPAITPIATDPKPDGQLTLSEACAKIIELRHILRIERKRHSLSEKALTKYTEILERQIADLYEAFALLGKPLIPSHLDRPARKH